MKYTPLIREEVKNVIHGKGCASRTPVTLHFWTHPYDFSEPQKVLDIMNDYPEDMQIIGLRLPDVYNSPDDSPEYRWVNYKPIEQQKNIGIDSHIPIPDWSLLDAIIANFPDSNYAGAFPHNPPDDGRYRALHWWYCLFERHWQLRGMENALTDYYFYPDEVHKLFRACTDYYIGIIERAVKEIGIDAIFTSDDLGTQVSQFFSPEVFEEFYYPYYKEIIDKAHSLNVDVLLHACGCVEKFIPYFIDLGLNALHPIQKYTMDEKKIAATYGDKICIWAGFDVQRVIPFGTPDDVRSEVRFMRECYHRTDGRFMFTAGNGINGDCTIESLAALYDEAYKI